ncbi:MAG: phage portal protein [Gordonibacter sp.]|uniref:phage portal protein n=1 Tax=Gordonibacter sp. TaxID=1968902 RepID=UPI002FCB9092
MAEKRGDYSYMVEWLHKLGYSTDTRMQERVSGYWGWFTADNGWYHYSQRKGFRLHKFERTSLCPAALVANEWASLLMTETTAISSDDSVFNDWIDQHFEGFAIDNADFVARAFALGTGAWAIDIKNVTDDIVSPNADIKIVNYDATQIIPLTYSSSDCTQAAFASRVEVGGKDYNQCQAHVNIGGTYHIITQLFTTRSHRQAVADGVIEDCDTGSSTPTFALFRPAVPNDHFDYSALGASVFDKAIGAIKTVDESATSLVDHIRVGRPKVFIDDSMIEKRNTKDANNKTVMDYTAFGEADDIIFRVKAGEEGKQINVIQPDLKVSENTDAINTGLKELSLLCGFGNGYFSWDAHTGIKTATEVSADNSILARSIKKHENGIRKSIIRIVRGMAGVCRGVLGETVPDGKITVSFDDSIITDTVSEKAQMMSEVAQGIARPWEYRVKFYNESVDDAISACATPETEIDDLLS